MEIKSEITPKSLEKLDSTLDEMIFYTRDSIRLYDQNRPLAKKMATEASLMLEKFNQDYSQLKIENESYKILTGVMLKIIKGEPVPEEKMDYCIELVGDLQKENKEKVKKAAHYFKKNL